MTEGTQMDVMLLAAGVIASAIIWALTWKRYRGLQYDLLRLALTAVLTGNVVLSWADGIDVYALTGFMLHGNDLPLPLRSVFAHWFFAIGVLFFSGKGLIFFTGESRWVATWRWVGGGSCAPCLALIAAVLVVSGVLYSAYHQIQKQREEHMAEMIKRSLRHAPEAIACVTSASEARYGRKAAVPPRCGGRGVTGVAPQAASIGMPDERPDNTERDPHSDRRADDLYRPR